MPKPARFVRSYRHNTGLLRTDEQTDREMTTAYTARGKNDAVRISKSGGYENKTGKIRDKIFSIS